VELGGGDDLGQFLHIDGLDVDNVWMAHVGQGQSSVLARLVFSASLSPKRRTETLIANSQVPQV